MDLSSQLGPFIRSIRNSSNGQMSEASDRKKDNLGNHTLNERIDKAGIIPETKLF
jgi:hypothetical protein